MLLKAFLWRYLAEPPETFPGQRHHTIGIKLQAETITKKREASSSSSSSSSQVYLFVHSGLNLSSLSDSQDVARDSNIIIIIIIMTYYLHNNLKV